MNEAIARSIRIDRVKKNAARLLIGFAFITATSGAAPAVECEAAAGALTLCSCGGTASIRRAMESAAFVAIAVVDTTASSTAVGNAHSWPLRIERAWRWPGGGAAPPRTVTVVQPSASHPCAIQISPGERQLVVASVRVSDGALVLGHKCATPWGAVDTLGPMAADNRRFAGDVAVRNIAQHQARILDSLHTFGPGTTP